MLGHLKSKKLDKREQGQRKSERKKRLDLKRTHCMCAKNILHGFNESMAQLAHSISGAMTLVGL